MIGQDFPKIEWSIFGLDLLEPNAFIGDLLLFITSIILANKIKKQNNAHPFYKWWTQFFLLFGWSFLLGGFGHLLYNYLGLWGKYPSWLLGMVATFYLTNGMLSLWANDLQKKNFIQAAKILLFTGLAIELIVFFSVDITVDQSKGLLIPTVVSGIGLLFSLVFVGGTYHRNLDAGFRYLWLAACILLPNAFIQSQKINLHPWFDRNDFSHALLFSSLLLYYKTLRTTQHRIPFPNEHN
ncbi:MAG: DUF6962 family protein [Flavobacteriales bacterium]